ncbi:MAG: hypothetical protein WC373_09090 [Smithella sp.]|jgi:hypothetical protein
MICSICNGVVEWQGKLSDLSHTKCLSCGAINARVIDLDNPCNERNNMTTEEKNKAVCEMLGIHWHRRDEAKTLWLVCACGEGFTHSTTPDINRESLYIHCRKQNPDFSTDAGAVRLLRELEKWKGGKLFFANLMYFGKGIEAEDDDGYIHRELVTTPGLLLDKVYEWKERTVK